MKATGIVRRIDDLGRVVIPKEIRRTMRIPRGRPVTDSIVTVGKILSGYDADRPKSSFHFCIGLRSDLRPSYIFPLLVGIYSFTFSANMSIISKGGDANVLLLRWA